MNKLKDLVSENISLSLASSLGSVLNYIAQEPNVSQSQAGSGVEVRFLKDVVFLLIYEHNSQARSEHI